MPSKANTAHNLAEEPEKIGEEAEKRGIDRWRSNFRDWS
jgi:hypothetical protein